MKIMAIDFRELRVFLNEVQSWTKLDQDKGWIIFAQFTFILLGMPVN